MYIYLSKHNKTFNYKPLRNFYYCNVDIIIMLSISCTENYALVFCPLICIIYFQCFAITYCKAHRNFQASIRIVFDFRYQFQFLYNVFMTNICQASRLTCTHTQNWYLLSLTWHWQVSQTGMYGKPTYCQVKNFLLFSIILFKQTNASFIKIDQFGLFFFFFK